MPVRGDHTFRIGGENMATKTGRVRTDTLMRRIIKANALDDVFRQNEASMQPEGFRECLAALCEARGLDRSLFCTVLRQLDLSRTQLSGDIAEYSAGQKKKVLLAASLLTPAHLYIWDEPLNYIDIFSRMQLETLLAAYRPTMLFAEHDIRFRENTEAETFCFIPFLQRLPVLYRHQRSMRHCPIT